ncbi:MAG: hypothetical protein DYG98_04665 [Haliscomenobacteraceae bacterium CHB4]|nr:hypothetical protein [Haliscomenobacteraceae bacterium CHB4]
MREDIRLENVNNLADKMIGAGQRYNFGKYARQNVVIGKPVFKPAEQQKINFVSTWTMDF